MPPSPWIISQQPHLLIPPHRKVEVAAYELEARDINTQSRATHDDGWFSFYCGSSYTVSVLVWESFSPLYHLLKVMIIRTKAETKTRKMYDIAPDCPFAVWPLSLPSLNSSGKSGCIYKAMGTLWENKSLCRKMTFSWQQVVWWEENIFLLILAWLWLTRADIWLCTRLANIINPSSSSFISCLIIFHFPFFKTQK